MIRMFLRGSLGGGGGGGMTSSRGIYEKHQVIRSSSNSNYSHHKSSDSLFSAATSPHLLLHRHHQQHRPIDISVLNRNTCGGSLSSLPTAATTTSSMQHYSSTCYNNSGNSAGYFATRHADRTSTLGESYLGLDEYQSTPYYMYQCKNRDKKDFSNSTYEDAIELGINIPIRRVVGSINDYLYPAVPVSTAMHRNEKYIYINNQTRPFVDSTSTIRFV